MILPLCSALWGTNGCWAHLWLLHTRETQVSPAKGQQGSGGSQHRSCEESLRAGTSVWGEKGSWLSHSCVQELMAECEDDWTWPCLVVSSERTRRTGHKLKHRRFWSNTKKKPFHFEVIKHRKCCPESLWNLHPWRYLPDWTLPWVASRFLLSCDLMVLASSSEDARKGRMEGEGQKEHQAMKTEYVRVHFFLHTAVKQGGPSELSCAAAASRADASSERLTSSHSSTLKPKTPHFLRFCVPRHAWRGGGVTWTENTVIQGVGNLLPTAWVVQLWEAALSAECRGTQGGYCLIQSIILVFFHLSVLHFFLPKMMLKNPLLCPTWKHTLVVQQGMSLLLLGFDQAPVLKRGGDSWQLMIRTGSAPQVSEVHWQWQDSTGKKLLSLM